MQQHEQHKARFTAPEAFVIVVAAVGVVAVDQWNGGSWNSVVGVLVAIVVPIDWYINHRVIRRALADLRQVPRERRDSEIGRFLLASTQHELKTRLEADPLPPREGPVESFGFPRSRRYAAGARLGAAFLVMMAAWATAFTPSVPSALRLAGLVAAAGAGWAAWLLGRRWLHLQTILEVTPFGIREIHPGGRRRWVVWAQPLTLTNNQRRRRAELRPAGSAEAIMIGYDRLEFWRIIQLVWDYGGFQAAADAPVDTAPDGEAGGGAGAEENSGADTKPSGDADRPAAG